MNKRNFNKFMTKLSQNLNILDYGFVPLATMDNKNIIKEMTANFQVNHLPEYVANSLADRFNPKLQHPEAKTLFICAIPFNSLPQIVPKLFKEAYNSRPFYGLIANYATFNDYHYESKGIMNALIAELQNFLNIKFNFEIFADTSPIAERYFAQLANIGYIGKNHCLKPFHANSSTFLCGFICDVEIPKLNFDLTENINNCSECQKCLIQCPNDVLAGSEFNFKNCISSISMEQRQFLDKKQREKLHYHIFGCSNCSTACFTQNEADFKVDLEWFMTESAGKLKKIIKQTALNYAGLTLLRRNSLAVLENFNTPESFKLIQKFSKTTQSPLLQKTCSDILKNFHF